MISKEKNIQSNCIFHNFNPLRLATRIIKQLSIEICITVKVNYSSNVTSSIVLWCSSCTGGNSLYPPSSATGIATFWIFDGVFHLSCSHASHRTSTMPWKIKMNIISGSRSMGNIFKIIFLRIIHRPSISQKFLCALHAIL